MAEKGVRPFSVLWAHDIFEMHVLKQILKSVNVSIACDFLT